jgi:phenylpropionate dioxygenase-like ring-hydroxylating dioxygenase large terminal subunit
MAKRLSTRAASAAEALAPVVDGVELRPPPEDTFMNPRCYFSAELFELEMRSVFTRSWVFVGELSQVSTIGDFFTEDVGLEPIVVVRDRDGVLRAFSNTCPHRASLIATGAGNAGRTFVCPYHGWTFGLDGQLLGVPHQKRFVGAVDRDELGLREARVDVWGQWIFVNVSNDAPSLSDYLAPIPTDLADHRLTKVSRVHTIDDVVEANWKVVIDNAFCDYHLAHVHGKSIAAFVEPESLAESISDYTGRVFAPWKDSVLAGLRTAPGLHGDAARGSLAYSVFPNWFIGAFPSGGASVMWWSPVDLTHTRARVLNYSSDADTDPRSEYEQLMRVQDEDYEICRKVQRGLRSALYRPGPRHALELRIRGFQCRLMMMLAEAAADAGAATTGHETTARLSQPRTPA